MGDALSVQDWFERAAVAPVARWFAEREKTTRAGVGCGVAALGQSFDRAQEERTRPFLETCDEVGPAV